VDTSAIAKNWLDDYMRKKAGRNGSELKAEQQELGPGSKTVNNMEVDEITRGDLLAKRSIGEVMDEYRDVILPAQVCLVSVCIHVILNSLVWCSNMYAVNLSSSS